MTKEDLNKEVYEPIKELKQRFYDSKTQDDWNACKEELVELLAKAESVMDKDFYPKYKEGILASIKKMYDYKQKYFAKQGNGEKKTYQPKVTYLIQDDLAAALTKYIELQTKLLEVQYENIFKK